MSEPSFDSPLDAPPLEDPRFAVTVKNSRVVVEYVRLVLDAGGVAIFEAVCHTQHPKVLVAGGRHVYLVSSTQSKRVDDEATAPTTVLSFTFPAKGWSVVAVQAAKYVVTVVASDGRRREPEELWRRGK